MGRDGEGVGRVRGGREWGGLEEGWGGLGE